MVSRACPGAGSQNQLAFDSSPFRKTQEHINCTTNTPVNTKGPNHVVLRLYRETQPGHGKTLLLWCGFLRGVHQQLHFLLQAFHLSFLMPTTRKDEIETCFSHKLKYKKAGFWADWIPYRSGVRIEAPAVPTFSASQAHFPGDKVALEGNKSLATCSSQF